MTQPVRSPQNWSFASTRILAPPATARSIAASTSSTYTKINDRGAAVGYRGAARESRPLRLDHDHRRADRQQRVSRLSVRTWAAIQFDSAKDDLAKFHFCADVMTIQSRHHNGRVVRDALGSVAHSSSPYSRVRGCHGSGLVKMGNLAGKRRFRKSARDSGEGARRPGSGRARVPKTPETHAPYGPDRNSRQSGQHPPSRFPRHPW
jgi:hypothetical protein